MDVSNKKNVRPLDLRGKTVGGVSLEGSAVLHVLLTGERLQIVELNLKNGFHHPRHNHPENESIGYVLKGRLHMTIDDVEYTLEPGDAWRHRAGVFHSTTALEDTAAVELHAPPRPEFSTAQ